MSRESGALERGKGGKVRNPEQAITIALNAASVLNRRFLAINERRLAETKRKETSGQAAQVRQNGDFIRVMLHGKATCKGIAGRSRMGEVELQEAL